MKLAWWVELNITCFPNYPRNRLLDEWTHTFEDQLLLKAARGALDGWAKANSEN